MGYAKDIYEIVSHKAIGNKGDDQLYYTQIFLDPELRVSYRVGIRGRLKTREMISSII